MEIPQNPPVKKKSKRGRPKGRKTTYIRTTNVAPPTFFDVPEFVDYEGRRQKAKINRQPVNYGVSSEDEEEEIDPDKQRMQENIREALRRSSYEFSKLLEREEPKIERFYFVLTLLAFWENELVNRMLVKKSKETRISRYNKKLLKRHGTPNIYSDPEAPFNPKFLCVDRILDCNFSENPPKFLVKWEGSQYEQVTWETIDIEKNREKIERFSRQKVPPNPLPTTRKSLASGPHRSKVFNKMEKSPEFVNKGELRSYQLEGLNWLAFNWHNRRNCILADEMGLGKTIQSLSLLNYLHKSQGIRGPFLVVAPLSTLQNWKREIETWTDFNCIIYHGSGVSRHLIRFYEFYFYQDGKRIPHAYKFNILVTNYQALINDASVLVQIPWRCLIVDEAHCLKNRASKIYNELCAFEFDHVVLLSGTPIQNNVEELWNMLYFLDPVTFEDPEEFLEKFGDMTNEHQVKELNDILRSYLLRRLKADVETSLKGREETLIEVELTVLQRKYYRAVYDKNTDFLSSGGRGSGPSLMNICMQLRKICNHPYLLRGVEEAVLKYRSEQLGVPPNQLTIHQEVEMLVLSCGKMVLLSKLLPKLKKDGHRVLIFSQMVRMLDVLEDYVKYMGYGYERIDGNVVGSVRQQAIDRFSAPGSKKFVFLLCTKAGGLGINLTSADTVIIYDNDWNPQNDLQAMARAHRIGQTKEVKIYRLITRNSYESIMFQRAALKLGLDQAVLSCMRPRSGQNAKQVETLLKYGAYHVFNDEEGDSKANQFMDMGIDEILKDRATKMGEQKNEKANIFSKASYIPQDITDMSWDELGIKKKVEFIPYKRRRKQVRKPTDAFDEILDGDEEPGRDEEDSEYEDMSRRGRRRRGNMGYLPTAEELAKFDKQRNVIYYSNWTDVDRYKLITNLLTWGYGRFEKIAVHAKFDVPKSLDDIKAYSLLYIRQLYQMVREDSLPLLNNFYNLAYDDLLKILYFQKKRLKSLKSKKKTCENGYHCEKLGNSVHCDNYWHPRDLYPQLSRKRKPKEEKMDVVPDATPEEKKAPEGENEETSVKTEGVIKAEEEKKATDAPKFKKPVKKIYDEFEDPEKYKNLHDVSDVFFSFDRTIDKKELKALMKDHKTVPSIFKELMVDPSLAETNFLENSRDSCSHILKKIEGLIMCYKSMLEFSNVNFDNTPTEKVVVNIELLSEKFPDTMLPAEFVGFPEYPYQFDLKAIPKSSIPPSSVGWWGANEDFAMIWVCAMFGPPTNSDAYKQQYIKYCKMRNLLMCGSKVPPRNSQRFPTEKQLLNRWSKICWQLKLFFNQRISDQKRTNIEYRKRKARESWSNTEVDKFRKWICKLPLVFGDDEEFRKRQQRAGSANEKMYALFSKYADKRKKLRKSYKSVVTAYEDDFHQNPLMMSENQPVKFSPDVQKAYTPFKKQLDALIDLLKENGDYSMLLKLGQEPDPEEEETKRQHKAPVFHSQKKVPKLSPMEKKRWEFFCKCAGLTKKSPENCRSFFQKYRSWCWESLEMGSHAKNKNRKVSYATAKRVLERLQLFKEIARCVSYYDMRNPINKFFPNQHRSQFVLGYYEQLSPGQSVDLNYLWSENLEGKSESRVFGDGKPTPTFSSWNYVDDKALIYGIYYHGFEEWDAMKNNAHLNCFSTILKKKKKKKNSKDPSASVFSYPTPTAFYERVKWILHTAIGSRFPNISDMVVQLRAPLLQYAMPKPKKRLEEKASASEEYVPLQPLDDKLFPVPQIKSFIFQKSKAPEPLRFPELDGMDSSLRKRKKGGTRAAGKQKKKKTMD